jgi:hypothetical protein
MRCTMRVPLGNSGFVETYCYEPLNDKGECPIHGQQAFQRPSWMAEERWKKYVDKMSNMHRQTVIVDIKSHSNTAVVDGRGTDTNPPDRGTPDSDGKR